MFLWILSFIAIGQAAVISTPENCFSDKKFPCIIMTQAKTTLEAQGQKLHLSSNTIMAFSSPAEIQIVRGMVWGIAKKSVVLKTTFATFTTLPLTEYWLTAAKDKASFRVFVGEVAVLPRGGSENVILPGREVHASYVDYATRSCFVSNSSVIDMYQYVRDFSRVFPFGTASVEDHLNSVAKTVLSASEKESQYMREHASRQLASAIERDARLRANQERASRLEIYLRKLFRTKSNYEDN